MMANHRKFLNFPPKALIKDVLVPLPEMVNFPENATRDATAIIDCALDDLSSGLVENDVSRISALFWEQQTFWRDCLALTYHLRTFSGQRTIGLTLSELSAIRKIGKLAAVPGTQKVVPAGSSLTWLESFFTFHTKSPQGEARGRIVLVPVEDHSTGSVWRIWTLSTWLHGLTDFPFDVQRVWQPTRISDVQDQQVLIKDVLIIGGGNSGLITAANLKGLNIDPLIIDKNENIGDNWANRYETMKFHITKGFCQTPYLGYPDEAPELLARDDLSSHMKRYAESMHADVLLSTWAKATRWDEKILRWRVTLAPSGKEVVCKHIVLATGIGSQVPFEPSIPGKESYQGNTTHSVAFRSGKCLKDAGCESVTIIGSANTAFDVIADCFEAGLKTTMIQRSATYLVPLDYLRHPASFGAWDHIDQEFADPMMFCAPVAVGGSLLGQLHASMSLQEPDRYKKLNATGFQTLDSTRCNIMTNVFERGGGHFVDVGTGVELIEAGKVSIKSGVTPIAYTDHGLELSDHTSIRSDAVVWCTGFQDSDTRCVLDRVLGHGGDEIASKMDAVYAIDKEGELRGLWKRHPHVPGLWVVGGATGNQRWAGKVTALQIKAQLEGILPDAYLKEHKLCTLED